MTRSNLPIVHLDGFATRPFATRVFEKKAAAKSRCDALRARYDADVSTARPKTDTDNGNCVAAFHAAAGRRY